MTAPAPEQAPGPPRITALPFVYTAPVALGASGALLLAWGGLALATPWSSLTLSLTHVVTLGFVSMLAIGAFVPLTAIAGGGGVPWPRTTHAVYYLLVLGAVGLTWGTARLEPAPVFAAIGFLGLMGIVFVSHAWATLRRARARGPAVRALGVALFCFFLAASLGVWLAHGHGGMRFPGPRSLWLQVHLSAGLLGWIGGVLAALTWEHLADRDDAAPPPPPAVAWIRWGSAAGVTLPVAVLAFQYLGDVTGRDAALVATASVLSLPAVVAVWLLHPTVVLRSLSAASEDGATLFLRTGLGLGPLVALVGLTALVLGDPSFGVLFGWLAVYGWAATSFAGLVLAMGPRLLSGGAPPPRAALPETTARIAFGVHLAAVVVGAIAILSTRDTLARITGLLACADAALLLYLTIRTCGPRTLSSSPSPSSADPSSPPNP